MKKIHYLHKMILSFYFPVVILATAPLSNVQAHDPNVILNAGIGTATIDGVLSTGEWDSAATVNFPVNIPEGGTTPGTIFVMHDNNNLYLAIRFARTVLDLGNSASFEFDNDHGGEPKVTGDDVILHNSTSFFDIFRTTNPPCPPGSICSLFDTTDGGTNDGDGLLANDGTFTIYEFSHPLDSADDAHDFSLSPGNTVGFMASIRILNPGIADTIFPSTNASLYGDIVISTNVIDIKPGSFPNSINPQSRGEIPVAIFTTDFFDATTVDWSTVKFGVTGTEAFAGHSSLKDVDGDGETDMVLHFITLDTGIQCGDTSASLKGKTLGGELLAGTDSINTVGCK